MGIAVPYGNAKTIPFEKQYFSGGANSVRGWTVRDLGPGSFVRADIVALTALAALLVLGILTPAEALAGFSSPIVIMMIGLFVMVMP